MHYTLEILMKHAGVYIKSIVILHVRKLEFDSFHCLHFKPKIMIAICSSTGIRRYRWKCRFLLRWLSKCPLEIMAVMVLRRETVGISIGSTVMGGRNWGKTQSVSIKAVVMEFSSEGRTKAVAIICIGGGVLWAYLKVGGTCPPMYSHGESLYFKNNLHF